jgi:hypothetical protein
MERKGSLLCSQVPSTGPYRNPDQVHITSFYLFTKIHFNITLTYM